MIDRDPFSPDEKLLWERSVVPGGPSGACPSLVDLAAFVDGRASEAEREEVEAHLVDCADCLRAVRETLALLRDEAEALPFASPAAIAAAKALVREHERRVARSAPVARPGFWPTSPAFWPTSRRWGLAAAAILVVCSLGYLSGTSAFADDSNAPVDVLGEMTFGLFGADAESDPELELFAASVAFPDEEVDR